MPGLILGFILPGSVTWTLFGIAADICRGYDRNPRIEILGISFLAFDLTYQMLRALEFIHGAHGDTTLPLLHSVI